MPKCPDEIKRLVEHFDRNADSFVYELCGLTKKEIAIIEKQT